MPGRVLGRQIDDQPDRRHRFEGKPPDAEAADFDQAGQLRRRAHQQSARMRFHMSAVVRHQPREGQGALR